MRSNPATYLKIYDDIRKLFAHSPEARRWGIAPRDFSFNVAGGRCERCRGAGTVTIEMHFMADLETKCEACDGRRFQSHILAIRYNHLNVNEALDLTAEQARAFFASRPAIVKRLDALIAVGLGYVRLGQTTSTLSGGEAQRLKLARYLLADLEPAPLDAGGRSLPRMFLLDEPTTGLSATDVRRLLKALARLAAGGNTLVAIEHHLEFIAHADYVIDLGPAAAMRGAGSWRRAGRSISRRATNRKPAASCAVCSDCRKMGVRRVPRCASRPAHRSMIEMEATMRRNASFGRGATQLGFLDILTVAILAGILAYVSYLQFPAYRIPGATPQKTGAAVSPQFPVA